MFGLTVKGSDELEGLIAIKEDQDVGAAYLHYLKTAPHNDKRMTDHQRYEGVGGHLLAIAAEQSHEAGFGGLMYGFAENEKLLKHYIDYMGAEYIGAFHPYHFVIDESAANSLLMKYNYKWK